MAYRQCVEDQRRPILVCSSKIEGKEDQPAEVTLYPTKMLKTG